MSNAMTKATTGTLAIPDAEAVQVLRNSLYPGARPESVALVLSWCRATGRDPMKKPIHIVPMWVKDALTGQAGMRDVLMPGIGTYRTDAAASGQYAGKSEPVFGPEITRDLGGCTVTYPEWCKVTVQRLVAGKVRDFTAMERWTENYATAKRDSDAPNAMWRRRPYAQLAKCAESQALRMAFPDETGGSHTAEEMEGKTFDGVTLDAAPTTSAPAGGKLGALEQALDIDDRGIPNLDTPAPTPAPVPQQDDGGWIDEGSDRPTGIAYPQKPDEDRSNAIRFIQRMKACQSTAELVDFNRGAQVSEYRAWVKQNRQDLDAMIQEAEGARYHALVQMEQENAA